MDKMLDTTNIFNRGQLSRPATKRKVAGILRGRFPTTYEKHK